MDTIAIASASSMIVVLFGVGARIIMFRQRIVRGPQCARCPLYQTACKEIDRIKAIDDEAEPILLTSEMAI